MWVPATRASAGNRTPGLFLTMEALYRLSYRGVCGVSVGTARSCRAGTHPDLSSLWC